MDVELQNLPRYNTTGFGNRKRRNVGVLAYSENTVMHELTNNKNSFANVSHDKVLYEQHFQILIVMDWNRAILDGKSYKTREYIVTTQDLFLPNTSLQRRLCRGKVS